jgi:hypothetical protein
VSGGALAQLANKGVVLGGERAVGLDGGDEALRRRRRHFDEGDGLVAL